MYNLEAIGFQRHQKYLYSYLFFSYDLETQRMLIKLYDVSIGWF